MFSTLLDILKHLFRLIEKLERLIERLENDRCRRLHLGFKFSTSQFAALGDHMTFTMLANQSVKVLGTPLDINGNPSPATLSNQNYTTSDAGVFTVSPDPAVPGGAILTAVAAGTATLTETATATEPDGTTQESIQGVATIIITAVPPPPPPVAASITFAFGTPTP